MTLRRSTGWRSAVVALATGIVVAGLLAPARVEAVVANPDWAALDGCSDFTGSVVTRTASGFDVADAFGYSWDSSVLTAGRWRVVPAEDGVLMLHEYGMTWLVPVLRLARDTADLSLVDDLVARVADTLTWRPDNGAVHDPVWNEGTNLRRQQSLNCLYAVTHDPRLTNLIVAVANANMDGHRYWGPPSRPPHNHGLMANIALLEAGELLSRSDWTAVAVRRMAAAVDLSFTPAGISIEQSSAYDFAVVETWSSAADELRALGTPAALVVAAHVEDVLVRARSALAYLVQPDGMLVPFGDGMAGPVVAARQAGTVLVDRVAGVLADRWTWGRADDYFATRYGGPIRMHGHEDRMSFVWWGGGRAVVVDPGTQTYTLSRTRTWTLSPVAHSTAVVSGRRFVPAATISVSTALAGTRHRISESGRPYGLPQSRLFDVDSAANAIGITDRVTGGRITQVLPLAASWRLTSRNAAGTTATFTDGAGAKLILATTGRIVSVLRGAPGLSGGWMFTMVPPAAVPGTRVLISGGAMVYTRLTVRATGGAAPQGPAVRQSAVPTRTFELDD